MILDHKLKKFNLFSQQVCETISSVVHCDMTVIDNSFVRIAGTGQFYERIGETLDKNNNFYIAMDKKQNCIISNHKIDIKNDNYFFIENPTMGEEVSILIPLISDGTVVAGMGLSALNKKNMMEIINNYGIYFDFMGKMSELLSSKLKNLLVKDEMNLLKNNLNVIIDTLTDGVVCIDMNEKITFVNHSAEYLLDLDKSQILGTNINSFVKLKDGNNIIKSNMEINNVYSYMIIDKQEVPVLISIKNINSNGGTNNRTLGKVLFLQKISDIKKKHNIISGKEDKFSIKNILGHSKAIEKTKNLIETVAKSPSTILITGESGTGKELCAKAIHSESPRKNGPFIPINCSAIPEALLESELFGYEKGAFTGASEKGKIGKFELANYGTIFLDEIGDMPLGLQAKILRVLQEKSIIRIGGNKVIPLDVRIVTATNRNLVELIEDKLFREDLYYRINVIPIHMPSLRDRKDDIPLLANEFLRKHSISMGRNITGFDYSAMEALMSYEWFGNVRELQNAIEYACNIETSNLISLNSLPECIKSPLYPKQEDPCENNLGEEQTVDERESEKEQIKNMLLLYGESVESKKLIAEKLDMGIATLYRRIKQYNID